MRRLHLWLGFTGILLVAAGGVLGFLAGRWAAPRQCNAPPAFSTLLLPEYSSYWLLRSKEIWDELELDPGQRTEIEDLLAGHYQRDRELRGDLEELAQGTLSNLVEILTGRQRERLAAFQERYSKAHVEAEAVRELVLLRREVGLTAEQEPRAYQILYDDISDKRDVFKDLRERSEPQDRSAMRDEIRRRFKEIDLRRFDRFSQVLDERQLEAYQKFLEERREGWRRGRHGRGDDRDKDRSERSEAGSGENEPNC